MADVEPLFVIDGVPVNNSTFSTTNFNPIDAGSTTGVGGQDVGGELEGTSAPNRMMDLNPGGHRERRDPEGRGGGGDLRRARGEWRHSHHDQARPIGPDALLAPQLRHATTRSRSSIRCSAKYGQGQRGASAPITRSWGAAVTGDDVRSRARSVRHGPHPRQHVERLRRQRPHDVLSVGELQPQRRRVRRSEQLLTIAATVRLNASHHLTDGLTVGGNFSFADTRGHMTQRGNNVNGLLLGLFRTPPDFNNQPYLDPTTGLHRSYMVPNATLATAGQTRNVRQSVLRSEL